jgi:hypothetical protein
MGVKQESGDSVLYAKDRRGGYRRRENDGDKDFDWGNMNNHQRVCYRCGHPWHIAQFCIADMSDDVKHCILNHSANIAFMVLDDRNNNDLFMFRVDHRPNKPTSLAFAFSDLALTELDDFPWCLEVPTNTDICFRLRMPRCRLDPGKNLLSPVLYRTYDWKGGSTPPFQL